MPSELWLVPGADLPAPEDTLSRVRGGGYAKAVALVGYRQDVEANDASRALPYGSRGEGVEEIVFLRLGATGADLVFEDDAWPGEDRTWVTEDLGVALDLVQEFAGELEPALSLVVVVGDEDLLAAVRGRLT